jgi:hypothetical protein
LGASAFTGTMEETSRCRSSVCDIQQTSRDENKRTSVEVRRFQAALVGDTSSSCQASFKLSLISYVPKSAVNCSIVVPLPSAGPNTVFIAFQSKA